MTNTRLLAATLCLGVYFGLGAIFNWLTQHELRWGLSYTLGVIVVSLAALALLLAVLMTIVGITS